MYYESKGMDEFVDGDGDGEGEAERHEELDVVGD